MPNKQVEMYKIKRLFKLYQEGISRRQISVQLSISRNTVNKYIDFIEQYGFTHYEIKQLTDPELYALFKKEEKPKPERLKTLEQYFPYFDKELRKTGVTRHLLWEEYIQKHPNGYQVSQFKYWYREWCMSISPVMHLTHKSGDKIFIDYTGKKLQIVDEHTGEVKNLEVFVCVLGSSQYTYAEASESQKKEDFIRSVENALWFYQGVPKALVTDNLKAAVTKSHRYEPTINETFADFATHYDTTILPTRVYKPRDKAIVENTVRILYTRVFAKLRNKTFHNKEDLNEQILILLKDHNTRSFRGRDYSRRSLYEQTDKPALKPLPQRKYEMNSYANGTVHKNSHVYLSKDKHYYSVPFKFIGKKIRIIYSKSRVRVFYRQLCIAEHTRNRKRYQYTTNSDHMPSYHRFVSEWNSEKFIKWASYIGKDCKAFIIKVLDKKQHPEQSYKSCMGILHLAKKVGNKRLNNACKRALDYHAYNYKIIQQILEKGWDQVDSESESSLELPFHKNIRGREYYK